MKLLKRLMLSSLMIAGGMVFGSSAARTAPLGFQEYPSPYGDLRGLIDRTQNDLRAAADLEHGNEKQRDRYRKAQEHLSNVDKRLVKGRFDKGDFEHSIGDIKGILEHNTLQPSTRDALARDVSDLKVARDRSY